MSNAPFYVTVLIKRGIIVLTQSRITYTVLIIVIFLNMNIITPILVVSGRMPMMTEDGCPIQ